MVFTLVRRYQELVRAPSFAEYSADLKAIEVKRTVMPLMERLAIEGLGAQEFAVSEGGLLAEKTSEMIKQVLSAALR